MEGMKNNSAILSPAEYKETINLLTKTSKHNHLIFEIIKTDVLPLLENKGSFLDVGSGPGLITKQLIPIFIESTAVEKNPELWELYKELPIQLFKGDWNNFQSDKSYDLVLCSHVLYHLDKEDMKEFIGKLLDYTSKYGVCFIAMMAPRGENHELHSSFNPEYIHSGLIKQILEEYGVSFELRKATNTFDADTFEQMANLCYFLILEDCLTHEQRESLNEQVFKEKIQKAVMKLKQPDGKFKLVQEEDYFIISPKT